MAVLAVLWALYIGYELIAPTAQRPTSTLMSNIVWGLFLLGAFFVESRQERAAEEELT